MNATIATVKHNEAKNGIEISFPGKPQPTVLQDLKDNGFRWSRFSKVWYKRVSKDAANVAAKYGTLPSSLSDEAIDDRNETASTAAMVDEQERMTFERY